ncbi:MAG: hypothetical protein M0Z59_07445 [Nitrospiraceae bacterium]|nr:hypothetical protein [Nitrospiraceae bacterium]
MGKKQKIEALIEEAKKEVLDSLYCLTDKGLEKMHVVSLDKKQQKAFNKVLRDSGLVSIKKLPDNWKPSPGCTDLTETAEMKVYHIAACGQKVLDGANKGGTASRNSKYDLDAIQNEAETIWNVNPNLSKIQVARMIQKKLKLPSSAISFIRQNIKKPS